MAWNRIRGHGDIARAFGRVVASGRLAHAYLFAGPPGIGKQMFAVELAKALLCEAKDREQLEACGGCAACLLIDAGNHPDLFAVTRPEEKVEFPIETVRELCRALSLKPARGQRKIAIVDDADDLNDASANCFLKTLEEPGPGSLLILIGTSPERQLSTIVSRCQVIRFAPLPVAEVATILRAQDAEPALIERLAQLSGGSPGQAQLLAEPALWSFREQLIEGLARNPIDTVGLAKQFTEFVEEAGKEGGPKRRRASLVLRLLIEFLNDLLRRQVGQPPLFAQPRDARLLEELGNQLDADSTIEIIDRVLEADIQIDRRLQLVLVIEALLDAIGQKVAAQASVASVASGNRR